MTIDSRLYLPPSYSNDFARSIGVSKCPCLREGLDGAWMPELGPSGASLFDWSGLKRHGTIENLISTSWVIGKNPRAQGAYALNYNGTDNRIALPDIGTAETYPFSFVAWFKTTSTDTTKALVTQWSSIASANRAQLYSNSDADNLCWNVRSATAEAEICFSAVSLADDKWHMAIGISRASNDHELYIDNISRGTSATSVTGIAVDSMNIGDWPAVAGYEYTGNIGAVFIYRRILNAIERQLLFEDVLGSFRLRSLLFVNAPVVAVSVADNLVPFIVDQQRRRRAA